jgi:hypothetical protein
MAKPVTVKRGYPTSRQRECPQGPPWRCVGCQYIMSRSEKPYCRICRAKGLGKEPV